MNSGHGIHRTARTLAAFFTVFSVPSVALLPISCEAPMISSGNDLRRIYVDFFANLPNAPHQVVASAPLIPPDDPTLMFTSAGMVQFKRYYSGEIDPLPYRRAVTCQKCLRAGGKGSDLENVGRTLRHHTFFEMLGNFSFGDYFKREAVRWGWQFCTEVMQLPKDHIFPTIFENDDEAEAIWREETDCPNAPVRLDAKENFWGPAGDSGACGPCSEVKFFMGSKEELAKARDLYNQGEKGIAELARRIVDEGDTFLEIWNMVFPQFDQQRDGSRPILKNRGIDTGAGLERMTTALLWLQGKAATPYETDLLWPITSATAKALGVEYQTVLKEKAVHQEVASYVESQLARMQGSAHAALQSALQRHQANPTAQTVSSLIAEAFHTSQDAGGMEQQASLRMGWELKQLEKGNPAEQRLSVNAVADHIRALVFTYAEGMTPGNIGRGYVLRRIQRRALRFASLLGQDKPFMASLVDPVLEAMGGAYPELKANAAHIKKVFTIEEETFLRTLRRGEKLLEEALDAAKNRADKSVSGEQAFQLWDTYGFPVDMTLEIAEEAGVAVDMPGFQKAMLRQKEQSKGARKEGGANVNLAAGADLREALGETEFTGYASVRGATESKVVALLREGQRVEALEEGQSGAVVLNRTPFYAESGGQIGDTGTIEGPGGVFEVEDTKKAEGVWLHLGTAAGRIAVGDAVAAKVDADRRASIVRNHSSTHLLQAALKKHVGGHVTQAGSFVGPDYLRFDFAQPEPIPADVLRRVQEEVNALILADLPVCTEVLPLEEAKKKGAIAVFGEKYGPIVRVVRMGEEDAGAPSIEFCGGTHLQRTSQAGRFRIVSEASIASGVRRIEALTGEAAVQAEAEEQFAVVAPLQSALSVKGAALVERVELLQAQLKQAQKELAAARQKAATSNLDQVVGSAKAIAGARVGVLSLPDLAAGELKSVATAILEKLGPDGVAVVFSEADGKASVVAAVGKDAQGRYPAGKVVNALLAPLGGKGGGKADIAQGGAKGGDVQGVLNQAAELISAIS